MALAERWARWGTVVVPAWLGLMYILPANLVAVAVVTAAMFLLGMAVAPLRRSESGVLLALGLYAVMFKLNLAHAPMRYRLAALLVVAIGLSPLVLLPLRRYSGFPLVHVFGIVTAIYAAATGLLSQHADAFGGRLPDGHRTAGLVMNALFLAGVVIGAFLLTPRDRLDEEDPVQEDLPRVMLSRAWLLIFASFSGTILLNTLGLRSAVGGLAVGVDTGRTLGFLVLFLAWLRGQALPPHYVALAVILVVFDVLNGFGSTLLYSGAATPVACLILYLAERRRVPWGVLTTVVVAAVILNSVKTTYRHGPESDAQRSQLDTGIYLVAQTFSTKTYTVARMSKSAARFSYTATDDLAYLAHVVPRRYPYWDRSTYRYALLAPIPRLLVPFKPTSSYANTFGRQYGLIDRSDTSTSPNMPLSAEAYVNFGYWGLPVVGLLVGMAIALLARRFRLRTLGGLLLACLVARQVLIGIESDTSYVVGGALATAALFYPVLRWLPGREVLVRDREDALPGPAGVGRPDLHPSQ